MDFQYDRPSMCRENIKDKCAPDMISTNGNYNQTILKIAKLKANIIQKHDKQDKKTELYRPKVRVASLSASEKCTYRTSCTQTRGMI